MNDTPTMAPAALADPELLDEMAVWLEQRLDETVGWRHASRLYGLTVLDRDGLRAGSAGAMRFAFLAEGYVYDVLAGPSAALATVYDALGLCCFGMATSGETELRRRCRTVLVANGSGQTTVNRLRGSGPERLGRPTGPVAELVAALFGDSETTETGRCT